MGFKVKENLNSISKGFELGCFKMGYFLKKKGYIK